MIDACRGSFNNFLPDVWIAVDNYKTKNKEECSQGYGLSLVGETTNDFYVSYDIINTVSEEDITPEDLSRKCCLSFLEEVFYSGAVDTHHQGFILFLMALSTSNAVSKVKLGRVSENTLLRLIKNIFGVKYKIDEHEQDDYDEEINEENEEIDENLEEDDLDEIDENNNNKPEPQMLPNRLIFSCVGIGLKNVARIEV